MERQLWSPPTTAQLDKECTMTELLRLAFIGVLAFNIIIIMLACIVIAIVMGRHKD